MGGLFLIMLSDNSIAIKGDFSPLLNSLTTAFVVAEE
jgi:hypothetical protein